MEKNYTLDTAFGKKKYTLDTAFQGDQGWHFKSNLPTYPANLTDTTILRNVILILNHILIGYMLICHPI